MTSVVGKAFFCVLSALYPILIFCGLLIWDFSPRKMSLLPLFLAALYGISFGKKGRKSSRELFIVALLLLCGGLAFVLDNATVFKFYPVFVNVGFLCLFAASLFGGSSFAFRLATLSDKRILLFSDRFYVERYCRRVTLVWCAFFVLNASISLCTILWGSTKTWSLYNGAVAYVLMGILFAVEFIVRKWKLGMWHVYVPFSQLKEDSRPEDSVVCFEGDGLSGNFKTWANFKEDVSKLRMAIESRRYTAWIVSVEDIYYFLVAVFALFQSGKKILFTANRAPEYIREIRRENVGFLNDTGSENAEQIPEILKNALPEKPWQPFDISKTETAFYTSGTTGVPKEISKKGTFLENESNALAARFEKELVYRNVYTTVNHHHIFGMAFGIFLPISAGLPIRRRRFEFPEELDRIVKEPAFIISSPAFLKRLVASGKQKLPFRKKPFWLSAGGVLPGEVASRVAAISGAEVQEIYGCTEAGAIATRRFGESKFWKPIFPNEVSLAENGCLKIRSNYTDANGFVTGDLGKMEKNGCFSLLGRADSIVKIEEKRISLPEVENRLRESGFVRDARVVPMSGKRQFLAAAIVLNESGMDKFQGVPKKEVNAFFGEHLSKFLESTVLPKKWRYLEELPQDAMGKVKTRDVQSLFEIPENPNFKILRYQRNGNEFFVKFKIPESSDYFDGHFPDFKLLPAVVQMDLVLRFFRGFLKMQTDLIRFPRIKFSSPIFPNMPVTVHEVYSPETGKVTFRIEAEDGKLCASGSILLKKDF